MANRVSVPQSEMKEKIMAVMTNLGVPEKDADIFSDTLIDAEITGVESHGITRMKAYADRILSGALNPTGDIKLDVRGNVVSVDAGNGFGQIATTRAYEKCIEIAKESGIACAGIYNSNHLGACAYYANKIAEQGCIAFVASDCAPAVAPFGGLTPLLGTNPIGIAFPAKDQTFCIDMSTSASAKGKIRIYGRKGLQIPVGWGCDAEGNDTTDPWAVLDGGTLMPMGGHKGYGLSMMVDVLSALLTGAGLSYQTVTLLNPNGKSNYGHFVCVIDIEHFLPLDEFEQRAQDWFEMIKASKPRPGMKIMIPGEPEDIARAKAAETQEVNLLEGTMDIVNEYYEKYGKKQ